MSWLFCCGTSDVQRQKEKGVTVDLSKPLQPQQNIEKISIEKGNGGTDFDELSGKQSDQSKMLNQILLQKTGQNRRRTITDDIQQDMPFSVAQGKNDNTLESITDLNGTTSLNNTTQTNNLKIINDKRLSNYLLQAQKILNKNTNQNLQSVQQEQHEDDSMKHLDKKIMSQQIQEEDDNNISQNFTSYGQNHQNFLSSHNISAKISAVNSRKNTDLQQSSKQNVGTNSRNSKISTGQGGTSQKINKGLKKNQHEEVLDQGRNTMQLKSTKSQGTANNFQFPTMNTSPKNGKINGKQVNLLQKSPPVIKTKQTSKFITPKQQADNITQKQNTSYNNSSLKVIQNNNNSEDEVFPSQQSAFSYQPKYFKPNPTTNNRTSITNKGNGLSQSHNISGQMSNTYSRIIHQQENSIGELNQSKDGKINNGQIMNNTTGIAENLLGDQQQSNGLMEEYSATSTIIPISGQISGNPSILNKEYFQHTPQSLACQISQNIQDEQQKIKIIENNNQEELQ